MKPIKLCFLGTPDFATIHLNALLKDSNYEVVGVVTQPDRQSGRKMQLTPSPVKKVALENSLPVLTPENLRKEENVFEIIKSWKAEIAVVVAFGQILSQDFLDSFKFGAVNVHGSLLPKWRGAAPIQRALESGDELTGVSLQRMVKKLDAGPIIAERRMVLDNTINATELYAQMAILGCELLNQELIKYIEGKIIPRVQNESEVSVAKKIEKEEALLNWNDEASQIHNRVRAFTMGPGTYVIFQGKRLKIHKTKVVEESEFSGAGTVAQATAQKLNIQTSKNQISLLEVQPESKSKISIQDFLKNLNLKKGDMFV